MGGYAKMLSGRTETQQEIQSPKKREQKRSNEEVGIVGQ